MAYCLGGKLILADGSNRLQINKKFTDRTKKVGLNVAPGLHIREGAQGK